MWNFLTHVCNRFSWSVPKHIWPRYAKTKVRKIQSKRSSDRRLFSHWSFWPSRHTHQRSVDTRQQLISAACRYYEKGEIPTFFLFIFFFFWRSYLSCYFWRYCVKILFWKHPALYFVTKKVIVRHNHLFSSATRIFVWKLL